MRTTLNAVRVVMYTVVCSFVAALFAGAAVAVVQQPPGSRITMDVPDTFEVSKLFSGFIYPAAGVSIVIAELPTDRYDQVVAGFTDDALAQKGITAVKRSQLKRSDKHVYFIGEQTNRGRRYRKHVLLMSDKRTVGVITVNVPLGDSVGGFVTPEQITAALNSASFTDKAAPIIKQFKLGYLGPFKEAGKLVGSAILYTTDGQLRPSKPNEKRSLVIVAPSVDRVSVSDLSEFSERAMRSIGGYTNLKIVANNAVEIGGLKGAEVAATATSSSSKAAVQLRQLVLARTNGGYFRLLAIIQDDEADKLLPEVDKLFKGFQPKS